MQIVVVSQLPRQGLAVSLCLSCLFGRACASGSHGVCSPESIPALSAPQTEESDVCARAERDGRWAGRRPRWKVSREAHRLSGGDVRLCDREEGPVGIVAASDGRESKGAGGSVAFLLPPGSRLLSKKGE